MCSFRDSALRCWGLWRYFAQQPESQDLSQSQKIPWRSEDALWGRSSCEEFVFPDIKQCENITEKRNLWRNTTSHPCHSPQMLHQLWTALKRKKHTRISGWDAATPGFVQLCSWEIPGQGNSRAPAFPGKPHNAHNHTLLWFYFRSSTPAGTSLSYNISS